MESAEAARRWARTWERAWREHDLELLLPLYADGCTFRSSPFREPREPLDYVAWAFSDEQSAEARFAEPLVVGDRAVVEWWATVVSVDGEQTLAGCSHLRFDAEGRVAEEHDYWNAAEGHEQPFPGWG